MQSSRLLASFLQFPARFPRRFSVRSLLIITGLVALAVGFFTRQLPSGSLSRWQSNQIKVGMSMKEVSDIAGFPLRVTMHSHSSTRRSWYYRIAAIDLERQMLTVTFSPFDDKVASVSRSPLSLEDPPEVILPLTKYPSHSKCHIRLEANN